jgi:hypothetical protein
MPNTKASRVSGAIKKGRSSPKYARSTFGDNDLALWGGERRDGSRGPDRWEKSKAGNMIEAARRRGAIRED